VTARRCTRCGRRGVWTTKDTPTGQPWCSKCAGWHNEAKYAAAKAHADALIALDALGVAVATVAQASMVALANAGIPLYPDGCNLRVRWNGYEARHEIVRTDDFLRNGEPRILWRSEPSPHGPAWTGAEAVARLIELVEERTR